ncbi:Bacterioferritin [Paramagnetospirillum magnetotacticum MS-1]|uniref:Bacterioferritin n=1 Tax=Paramagnetospirillum magnetotacticum MS-1 TaxID=272627 RepID=A0A0C2YPS4_PARME|nr:bacterioferritin [Paramagnetospirillum magnetotacticum]KIL97093.1 Bacterioferritin [Paramagnetospirillum magnetotacticum MS-1]
MKGKKSVISRLNKLLVGELVAADQYFVHSRMYQEWGLQKLYERIDHERMDELEHADLLIRRILFLEGTPDISKRPGPNIGKDVPSMLKNDLDYELAVIAELKEVIAHCEAEKDYDSRRILQHILEETEQDHTLWLEQQLGLIARMGLQNYIQSAAGDIAQGAS